MLKKRWMLFLFLFFLLVLSINVHAASLRLDIDNDGSRNDFSGSYTDIDEPDPHDGDTTKIQSYYNPLWAYAIFSIDNHTSEIGEIISVTTYAVVRSTSSLNTFRFCVVLNGTTTTSHYWDTNTYTLYGYSWTINPQTGVAWTWDEIDDLQIGILDTKVNDISYFRVTQMYAVVIYYTNPNPITDESWSISSSGVSADLTINWTKSIDANYTLVRKQSGSYPTNVTEGTLVYNNTGNGTVDVGIEEPYYYTLWAYNNSTNLYSSPVYLEWSVSWINVYNESDPSENLSCWTVEISNEDGSEVFYSVCNNNSLIINVSDLPTGDKVTFLFNKTGYRPRSYILSIEPDEVITLNAYLPPTGTSNSYTFQVIDEYSQPVNDAFMIIKRYMDTTDVYENVSSIFTDGNGYTSCYLVSGQNYKFFISKTGFVTEISDWRPTDDDVGVVRVFMIYYVNLSGETIWDNMSITIEPFVADYFDNISFYFNISSYDNRLEYSNMTVFFYNNSTLKWDIVYQHNDSSSDGYRFSYNTTNGVGWYGLQCRFKKTGYEEYTFGYSLFNETVFLYKVFESFDFGNASYIDTGITRIVGESPVKVGNTIVPYTSLIVSVIITILLFTFSKSFAGLGLIIVGLVLGWFRNIFVLVDNDVIQITLVVGIIIFGVLAMLLIKKEE